MNKEKYVALDIYTYLFRTYYGTDKEEVEYRVKYGSNGVVNKVLDYIQQKYFEKDDKNGRNFSDK